MEFDGSILTKCTRDEKVAEKAEPKQQQMTLHCQQCNTVLGDSHGVCGEIKCMDSIMCLSKFILSSPYCRCRGQYNSCVCVLNIKKSAKVGELASSCWYNFMEIKKVDFFDNRLI